MDKKNKINLNLNYVKSFVKKGELSCLIFASVFSSILVLLASYLTKFVIESVSNQFDSNFVLMMSLLVVSILLFSISSFFETYLGAKFHLKAKNRMIESLQQKIVNSDFQTVSNQHSIELLSIVTSDSQIALGNYISIFPTFASAIVKLVGGLTFLFVINYKITLICLASGMLIALIVLLSKKPIRKLHFESQKLVAKSFSYVQETTKNLEVIQALGIENQIAEETRLRLDMAVSQLEKRAMFVSAINTLVYLAYELAFLVALAFGGIEIAKGNFSVADFVALIAFLSMLKAPFRSLTNLPTNYFSMQASAERIALILSFPKSSKCQNFQFDFIEFENVEFEYDKKVVLENVNLQIEKGEKIAIVGATGSGKTTFVRLMLGLLKPSQGTIWLKNNLSMIALNGVMQNAGYVPQTNMLMSGTIKSNLCLEKQFEDSEIQKACEIACIWQEIQEKPDGLDYVLKESGTGLSGGQIQRIAIARALLNFSNIIIFDEATSALDAEKEKEILQNLKSVNKTMIFVGHSAMVQTNCDKVFEIDGGKIFERKQI